MYNNEFNLFDSSNQQINHFMISIKGIFIFKSDSGITLYSKKLVDVQEDLFSAFLSAIKVFFNNLSLGGLLSFSSENYTFYLATENNCLTAIVVDNKNRSDKFFSLAYEISVQFYKSYQTFVDSKNVFNIPNKDQFDIILAKLISKFDETSSQIPKVMIRLYNVSENGELEPFEYSCDKQLFEKEIFIALNLITKKIYIIENAFKDVPRRKVFLATRSVDNLNQKEYKSEFHITHVTNEWDFERITEMIHKLLKRESFILQNQK